MRVCDVILGCKSVIVALCAPPACCVRVAKPKAANSLSQPTLNICQDLDNVLRSYSQCRFLRHLHLVSIFPHPYIRPDAHLVDNCREVGSGGVGGAAIQGRRVQSSGATGGDCPGAGAVALKLQPEVGPEDEGFRTPTGVSELLPTPRCSARFAFRRRLSHRSSCSPALRSSVYHSSLLPSPTITTHTPHTHKHPCPVLFIGCTISTAKTFSASGNFITKQVHAPAPLPP